MTDFGERYDAKRRSGISSFRSDGSRTSRDTDIEAGAAEEFAASFFGQPVNAQVYDRRGDGGRDFMLGGARVNVVHLGIWRDGSPRRSGHLIVNPHEPWRHADLYIVVRGSTATAFEMLGWQTHKELVSRPQRNFGFGYRYHCPVRHLRPIERLVAALRKRGLLGK